MMLARALLVSWISWIGAAEPSVPLHDPNPILLTSEDDLKRALEIEVRAEVEDSEAEDARVNEDTVVAKADIGQAQAASTKATSQKETQSASAELAKARKEREVATTKLEAEAEARREIEEKDAAIAAKAAQAVDQAKKKFTAMKEAQAEAQKQATARAAEDAGASAVDKASAKSQARAAASTKKMEGAKAAEEAARSARDAAEADAGHLRGSVKTLHGQVESSKGAVERGHLLYSILAVGIVLVGLLATWLSAEIWHRELHIKLHITHIVRLNREKHTLITSKGLGDPLVDDCSEKPTEMARAA